MSSANNLIEQRLMESITSLIYNRKREGDLPLGGLELFSPFIVVPLTPGCDVVRGNGSAARLTPGEDDTV